MKSLNFTTVGISILIVLNVAMAFVLFSGTTGKKHFRKTRMHTMQSHDKAEGKKHRGHFNKRSECFEAIGLTDEQKKEIKHLNRTHQKEMKMVRTQIRDLKKKERELVQAGTLNENQLSLLSNEFGQYQKDIYKLGLSKKQAIQNVLTVEQKSTLDERSCHLAFERGPRSPGFRSRL